MRVTLSQRARAEINHAIANAGSDAAAVRLLTRFEAAKRRLGLFPELGRVGRRAGTRELLIASTPYQFIYKVQEQRVYVLEIRDRRRGE